MDVSRDQIAELFHKHIRLVVRPDQDPDDSELFWCVKPASKEAFLDAVMTLLATQGTALGAPGVTLVDPGIHGVSGTWLMTEIAR